MHENRRSIQMESLTEIWQPSKNTIGLFWKTSLNQVTTPFSLCIVLYCIYKRTFYYVVMRHQMDELIQKTLCAIMIIKSKWKLIQ